MTEEQNQEQSQEQRPETWGEQMERELTLIRKLPFVKKAWVQPQHFQTISVLYRDDLSLLNKDDDRPARLFLFGSGEWLSLVELAKMNERVTRIEEAFKKELDLYDFYQKE